MARPTVSRHGVGARVDWPAKLRHFLQTLAFCLAVAAVQIGFAPGQPAGTTVAYSVSIGLVTWAVIDFGRHLFPSSVETGWPRGIANVLLVAAGIGAGYGLGMNAGEQVSRFYGWPLPGHGPDHWRSGLLITVVAGIVASYWFYSRTRSAWLERQMGEAQRHADEARLKLLETQLEPHMLFNTLANLRALIAVDPARAQQMLDHMIAYLRATLDASRATTHPLQAEFERLREYLELMAIRMGARLAFALELPAELAEVPVPTLLLQPLVENSIRHGLEPKVEGGQVTVRAWRAGDALVLEVADTGVGCVEPPAAGHGFGLVQVRERLATLHGDRARMQWLPQPQGGTCVRITLPWQVRA